MEDIIKRWEEELWNRFAIRETGKGDYNDKLFAFIRAKIQEARKQYGDFAKLNDIETLLKT